MNRHTLGICIASLAAGFLGVSSLRAADQDAVENAEPLQLTLEHYSLIPPSPNYDKRYALPPDPTIIPFSGWNFFSSDGQAQPWRKRSAPYRRVWVVRDGGHAEQRRWQRDNYRLFTYWRYPKASDAHRLFIRLQSQAKNDFGGFTYSDSETESDPRDNFSVHIFTINDLATVVDHAPMAVQYLQGDWQTVAKMDFDTAMPVGDKRFQVQYLGEPREDSPAVQGAKEPWFITKPLGEKEKKREPFTLECQTSRHPSRDEWDYRVTSHDKQGKPVPLNANYSLGTKDKSYKLARAELDKIDHFRIVRLPVIKQQLDDFELGPMIELLEEDTVQRRINVAPIDRFGESTSMTLQTFGPGKRCLVDLDTAAAITLPNPAPAGDDLAKFYEANGVDLVLLGPTEESDGMYRFQAVACSAYTLDEKAWHSTPDENIQAIRAQYPRYIGETQSFDAKCEWDVGEDRGKPQLITTADGGLTMLREQRDAGGEEGQLDSLTIEVRRMTMP